MTIDALQEAKRLEEIMKEKQKKFDAINQPIDQIGYDSWVSISFNSNGGRLTRNIQLPIPMVRFIHEQYKTQLLADIHSLKHRISKL